jgi:hypothetical protein
VDYADTPHALDSLGPHDRSDLYTDAPNEWDMDPADLNKWIADGAKDTDP